jgi:hypothetical protein
MVGKWVQRRQQYKTLFHQNTLFQRVLPEVKDANRRNQNA